MPLPAGYSVDQGSGPALPAGYKLDATYQPGASDRGTAAGQQIGQTGSIGSDLVKYSPVGAIKGLADNLRTLATNPKQFVSDVGEHVKANEQLFEKAKDAYSKGNYGEAVGHFLNYLNPFGGAFEDISGDVQNGNYGHAAAKAAGLASNALAGPAFDVATSPEVARVPGAVVAGVKAAAPDVAAGTAKAVAGEVAAKIPGMEWPARIAVQYPAVRQIARGAKAGGEAFESALKDLPAKVQAATETAASEGGDPLLAGLAKLRTKGTGGFNDLSSAEQEQVRSLADEFRNAGSGPEKPVQKAPDNLPEVPAQVPRNAGSAAPPKPQPRIAGLLPAAPKPAIVTEPPPDTSGIIPYPEEMLPENIRGKAASQAPTAPGVPKELPSETTKILDQMAQDGVFGKKYKSFASAPGDAQKTLLAIVRNVEPAQKPVTAPLPAQPAPANAAVTAPRIQEGSPALNLLLEGVGGDQAKVAEVLRQRNTGDTSARALADAQYAKGEATRAQNQAAYQAAARTDKAVKLATALNQHGVGLAELSAKPAAEVATLLKPLAKSLGINAPSTATVNEILFHLRRLEAQKKALPAAGTQ